MTRLAGPVRGVLFDYGNTLVSFDRPAEALRDAYVAIADRLREQLPAGSPIPPPEELISAVHDRVDEAVASHDASGRFDEIDLEPVYRDAYQAVCGAAPDAGLLDELIRLEQQAWFRGVHPVPDAIQTLVALREDGRRVGLCSNAPYHGATLREQIEHVGLAPLLDAITLSSDVGWRKPAPEIFRRAAADLGTPIDETIHVGDRLREDIEGARAAGLRAIWLARDADADGANADGVIRRLGELLTLLPPRVA